MSVCVTILLGLCNIKRVESFLKEHNHLHSHFRHEFKTSARSFEICQQARLLAEYSGVLCFLYLVFPSVLPCSLPSIFQNFYLSVSSLYIFSLYAHFHFFRTESSALSFYYLIILSICFRSLPPPPTLSLFAPFNSDT